jgi:hypothetical protein
MNETCKLAAILDRKAAVGVGDVRRSYRPRARRAGGREAGDMT